MDDLLLWSKDRRFGLLLKESILQNGIKQCVNADCQETGGILIGYYTPKHDCAVVTALSEPPEDSIKKPTLFVRGTLGIQNLINRAWQRHKHFYLGEWHFHPRGASIPSQCDLDQMRKLSKESKLKCPEPILLIIGGDPNDTWTVNAYVFPANQACVPLFDDSQLI